jgi:hypothetical protein
MQHSGLVKRTSIIDALTIIRLEGRRVLWNGDCDRPDYHALCDACGRLSPAGSLAEALAAACQWCRARGPRYRVH